MRTFFSEAFVLAAITILAYLYAYFFEMGHSVRFSYPPEIVGPTLSSFLGGWVIVLLFMLLGFLQLNLQYWPHTGRWKVGFVAVLIVYTLAILTFMAWNPRWGYVALLVSASAAAIAANVLYRRWTTSQQPAPADSGENPSSDGHMSPDLRDTFTIYDSRSSIPQYSIAYALTRYFGRDPLAYILLFLIAAPLVCMYAGFTTAAAQQRFYLLSDADGPGKPELIVRIVDGIVISVPYDPMSRTFETRVRVREVSELDESWLSSVQVGNIQADHSELPSIQGE